jgi:hypothetical protein
VWCSRLNELVSEVTIMTIAEIMHDCNKRKKKLWHNLSLKSCLDNHSSLARIFLILIIDVQCNQTGNIYRKLKIEITLVICFYSICTFVPKDLRHLNDLFLQLTLIIPVNSNGYFCAKYFAVRWSLGTIYKTVITPFFNIANIESYF